MTQPFHVLRRIRFSDCDPAGIVFYPQYFVLLNGVVEDWFDGPLGLGYQRTIMQRRIGLPTVHLEAQFEQVSRFGDDVAFTVDVHRLGRRSFTLDLACRGRVGELRMRARKVIVTTCLDTHQAIEVPEDVRRAIEGYDSAAQRLTGTSPARTPG